MKPLKYFKPELLKQYLKEMDFSKQVVFSALICERLIPNYETFHKETGFGDYKFLESTLNKIWNDLTSNNFTEQELRTLMDECFSLTPDSEDFESSYTGLAQEACISLYYLLNLLLTNDLENIIKVSDAAIETVYVFVIDSDDSIFPLSLKEALLNPLMQQELRLQYNSIQILKETNDFIDIKNIKNKIADTRE